MAKLDGFIYLVQTSEAYERPTIVEAHLSKSKADARVAKLNALADRAPVCPQVDDEESQWDAFWQAEAEWKAAHPLGPEPPGYLDQRYEVNAVPLAITKRASRA